MMQYYKLLLYFEDVETDAIHHALGDIERILLQPPHSYISQVEELKHNVWDLTLYTTPAALKLACDNTHNNLNIKTYYVATRC